MSTRGRIYGWCGLWSVPEAAPGPGVRLRLMGSALACFTFSVYAVIFTRGPKSHIF